MNNWPKTDFHIHATVHRLGNPQEDMTVANLVRRCEALSYSSVGIVEHLDRSPKHPLSCLEELVEEFRSVRRRVSASSSLDLFVGAELDIVDTNRPVDEGTSVARTREIKERLGLDYFLGAVHGVGSDVASAEAYIADHHRKLMALVEDCDFVDVVAHPWVTGHKLVQRGLMDDWHFGAIPEQMLEAFAQALVDHGKAFELNGKARKDFGDPAYRQFVRMLKDAGVAISIGSDAHRMEAVGTTSPLDEFLQEMDVPPRQIWTPKRT